MSIVPLDTVDILFDCGHWAGKILRREPKPEDVQDFLCGPVYYQLIDGGSLAPPNRTNRDDRSHLGREKGKRKAIANPMERRIDRLAGPRNQTLCHHILNIESFIICIVLFNKQ